MKNVILLLLSLCIFSCDLGGIDVLPGPDPDSQPDPISLNETLIAKGSLFGAGEEGISEQNLVINDTDSWNALIDKMNSINNVSDSFSETEIDFSEYQVIAVFSDIKPTGGNEIVLDISIKDEMIGVAITSIAPAGFAITVITQPFHIVKIKKTNLPIVFI